MAILFSAVDVTAYYTSGLTETTSNTNRPPNGVGRSSIVVAIQSPTYGFEIKPKASSFWLHAWRSMSNGGNGIVHLTLYDEFGNECLRLRRIGNGGSLWRFEKLISSTWTLIGDEFLWIASTVGDSVAQTNDYQFRPDGISVYANGNVVIEVNVDMSWLPQISRISFGANSALYVLYMAQVIVADESTLGWQLCELTPTSIGETSEFIGTVADINEAAINDTTFIHSDIPAKSTFKTTLQPIPSGLEIKGVGASVRARRSESGPQSVAPVIRVAGVDHVGEPRVNPDMAFHGQLHVWENNPDTSAPWTDADLIGFEVGVQSLD
ncbi:hypothetical protein G3A39_39325 [Paraburkholderia aspalathi]|nr:hypothetical protein [Paraburkholderia aspalathi]